MTKRLEYKPETVNFKIYFQGVSLELTSSRYFAYKSHAKTTYAHNNSQNV